VNTTQVPFDVFISLVKFDIEPGSKESIQLLIGMELAGSTYPEIFDIKMIQRLLSYKMFIRGIRIWGWFNLLYSTA
jgi:hypothetical protein